MTTLLAKPTVSLLEHSLQVLKLGIDFSLQLELPNRLRIKALLACALHDIGKASKDFQQYIRGLKKTSVIPHALLSFPLTLFTEVYLNRYYHWKVTDLIATAAVLSHHSPLRPRLYQGYECAEPLPLPETTVLLTELWSALQDTGVSGLPDPRQIVKDVNALLCYSPPNKLLDSNQFLPNSQTLRSIFQRSPTLDFAAVKTVLHLSDWLVSAERTSTHAITLQGGKQAIQNFTQTFNLRYFQREAANNKDAILWLRAPTGSGKTEALLLWAGNAERILYLLPTQATANAMYKRLQKIYGTEAVSLVHGRASYILHSEFDTPPLETQLFGSVFAKPVIVATLDQYLLGHLHGRHWEERRILSQRATVLFDEIHAYEPFTLGLLLAALRNEQPRRIAFASATLPSALRQFFPNGTLIEAEPEFWIQSRHQLKLESAPIDAALEKAITYAQQRKAVLIVANTVRKAQSLYQQLREQYNQQSIALLHSRFTFGDRQQKEQAVQIPRPGSIVIATQIVEVSMDISYDVLLTELAPLDALVQRMGRVNRRGETAAAPVWIFTELDKGTRYVYSSSILELSHQLLQQLPNSPTDRDLANATEQLYSTIISDSNSRWQHNFTQGQQTLIDVQSTLGCFTIDLKDEDLRKLFTTRQGIPSVEVLPQQFLDLANEWKCAGQWWRIIELFVPVPAFWLRHTHYFYPEPELHCMITTLPYDPTTGLQHPDQADWEEQIFI